MTASTAPVTAHPMATLIPLRWLTTLVTLLLLGGCATHYPYPVEVEDRSRDDVRDSRQQPGTGEQSEQSASEPVDSGVKVYPTGEGSLVTEPLDRPADTESGEPLRPASPAPSATVPRSSALLALLEKAEQQHQSGQTQQALSSLERAQRIAPREPLVYLQQARLRRDLGDKAAAEQLARKGLSLSSGNGEMQKAFNALLSTLTP